MIQPVLPKTVRYEKTEVLYKREFPVNGCVPLPRWFLRGDVRPLGAHAEKQENIYAETKL